MKLKKTKKVVWVMIIGIVFTLKFMFVMHVPGIISSTYHEDKQDFSFYYVPPSPLTIDSFEEGEEFDKNLFGTRNQRNLPFRREGEGNSMEGEESSIIDNII